VAITAQVGLERAHKESHQYVNIVNSFRTLTKWNARIERAWNIPEVVRKDLQIFQTEKLGPCHIEYPEDLAKEMCEGNPLSAEILRRGSPDERSLSWVAELVEQAGHPKFLAGNGLIRGKGLEDLLQFSKATQIPVETAFMGNGAVPAANDLLLLTIALQAHDYVSVGFDQADLIIAVGHDLVEYDPSRWNQDKNKKIIHIDFLPAEVNEFYQTTIEITGNIKDLHSM
jgi:acetolactate synthase-1/2/3 large subunit